MAVPGAGAPQCKCNTNGRMYKTLAFLLILLHFKRSIILTAYMKLNSRHYYPSSSRRSPRKRALVPVTWLQKESRKDAGGGSANRFRKDVDWSWRQKGSTWGIKGRSVGKMTQILPLLWEVAQTCS